MFNLQPTPIDLQFRLGRIPVRVHPGFWLIGLLGGWQPDDLRFTFIWVMALFVSILIHELGHALICEAYGWPSEILLYHFGGLTFSQRYHGQTPWKSIAVSIAGPCAGFALYGVVLFVAWQCLRTDVHLNRIALYAFYSLERISLWWGIVNLAPVLPLDGGHICRSFLDWLGMRNFELWTIRIGLVVGGLIAFYFLRIGEQFAGLLFVFLAIQNLSMLQQFRGRW